MTMKPLQGSIRTAFLGFFASHIIFTALVDGQALFGRWYPQSLQDLNAWYSTTFKDPLMGAAPGELLWFQSLVTCEILFQLPFFFAACYYLAAKDSPSYPDSFRCACIAYGAHTATTMAPILTTLVTNSAATVSERMMILGFYLPYLIFPVWILAIAVTDNDRETTIKNAKHAKRS
jgi:hypothetical protein